MEYVKKNFFKGSPLKQPLYLSFLAFLLLVPTIKTSARNNVSQDQVALDQVQTPVGRIKVNGVVTDANGEPLVGATVKQQGTTHGTMTDTNGHYSIYVPGNSSLVFSYMGYLTKELAVRGKNTLKTILNENAHQMNDVVVTALGIKRQARSLGYSTTDVKGEQFTQARDVNLGNALSGKVAGVSVAGNSTGIGGSSRVVIRGNASLTGNNQPLYVIDGVPYDNTNLGQASGYGGIDMGDGLSNLNPDDIADIQVLKGAAASALYGYRGGNGAILITTKSGKKGQPVTIDFNNNLQVNTINDYRDLQDQFGQGMHGNAPSDVTSAQKSETSSWGAPMNGQDAINFLGQTYKYNNVDNWKKFYNTGIDNQTSLSVSGAGSQIKYRFGISNLYDKSIMPNSGMGQQTINMNTTYDISKKLHFMVNGTYVFEKFNNRSGLADNNGNSNAPLYYHANSFDIDWMRGAAGQPWGTDDTGHEMLSGTNVYFNNPYWLQYRKTNNTNKNRLTGGMTLKYDITSWLNIQGSVTRDGFNMDFKQVQPMGAAADPQGWLTEYSKSYAEVNANYLLSFDKKFGDWNVDASFGGNTQRDITKQYMADGIRPFIVPDFPSANNIANRIYTKNYNEYRVNSVYATADIGFKNQVFLNLTGRNDWFSTLNPDHNSYFYPSASLSWVFSDTFKLPSWWNFAKVRASYAASSNGTSAYQNMLTYKFEDYIVNGQTMATVNNENLPNKNLKPVRIAEYEGGINLSFLDNRISIDAAYYSKTTTDDIALVSISNASGFNTAIENVGKIRNNGIEFMLDGVPVKTHDFMWKSTFNFAYNQSKVLYLGEGIDRLTVDGSNAPDVSIQNVVGKEYGQIVGYKYKRHNGQIVYNEQGVPERSDHLEDLGSGVYKYTGGWRNEFNYKNFTLSFLLDFKAGAKLYSATNAAYSSGGLLKNTVAGRSAANPAGYIVGQGVMSDGKGGYVPNTHGTDAETYWEGIASQDIAEPFVYDASFIKLRELSFGYTFPHSIVSKWKGVKGLSIAFVARNLWTILKYTPNIDPESSYNSSNAQGIERTGYPPTRSVGFNLNVKF